MEQFVREQFTDSLKAQAAKHAGVNAESLKLLGEAENFVFEAERNGKPVIMRIIHSSHRNPEQVLSELSWVNYLHDNGVTVARALEQTDGTLIKQWPTTSEDYFLSMLFEKASGAHPQPEEWNGKLFESQGRQIGKIHALTKAYETPAGTATRPQWNECDYFKLDKYLPPQEQLIRQNLEELMAYLKKLPKDKESFGLVHADAHQGNYFVNDGMITLFDFDDCEYNWFMNDIAIILYYSFWHKAVKVSREEFSKEFMGYFMNGYAKENTLDAKWFAEIPHFLKLREFMLYVFFHKKWLHEMNEGRQKMVDTYRHNLEHKVPYVDLDFTNL